MAKFVNWAGGREALAELDTIRFVATRTETHNDKEWMITQEIAIDFPDRYLAAEQWNEMRYTTISTPEGGAMGRKEGINRIAASRERAFKRAMARELPVLLNAFISGHAHGEHPSLIVTSLGEAEVDGRRAQRVTLALHGATSTLSIDAETGEPLALEFLGRDGTASVGVIRRSYTHHATSNGITLPVAYDVSLDGKPVKGAGKDFAQFEINLEFPENTFALSE